MVNTYAYVASTHLVGFAILLLTPTKYGKKGNPSVTWVLTWIHRPHRHTALFPPYILWQASIACIVPISPYHPSLILVLYVRYVTLLSQPLQLFSYKTVTLAGSIIVWEAHPLNHFIQVIYITNHAITNCIIQLKRVLARVTWVRLVGVVWCLLLYVEDWIFSSISCCT